MAEIRKKLKRPYKIDEEVLNLARAHKEVAGVNIDVFVAQAIKEKIDKLPKKVRDEVMEYANSHSYSD